MPDLGFKSRAELIQFVRDNIGLDSSTLGKGVVKNYNVYPRSLNGFNVLAPDSVGSGEIIAGGVGTDELAANSVRASKLFVPVARITGPAQSIPNNTTTLYNTFNSGQQNAAEDGTVMFALAAPDRATIRRLGYYLINVNWGWGANATGVRYTYLNINGGAVRYDMRDSPVFGDSQASLTYFLPLNVGNTVSVSCYQNSGVALNYTPELNVIFVSN
jgi:hypothetical protein